MTAAAIAVALRPSALAALVSVTITGAVVGETMTVTRKVGTGAPQPVMGASAVPAATRVLVDPEAPLNRAATWTVTTTSGATATSAALTVPADLATLADPVRGIVAECAVITRDDWRRTQRVDVVQVEGSTTPAVIWDVPSGKQMPVQLLTLDSTAETAIGALLDTGNALLLRCACGQHSDVWIQSIDSQAGASRLVKRSASVLRQWELGTCLVFGTNPRAAEAALGNTLGDVYDAVAVKTLGAISDRWATLGAIAEADLGA